MTTTGDIWARMAELAEQATHSWGERQADGSIRERSEFDGSRFAALLREEAAKQRAEPAAPSPVCGSAGCRESAVAHVGWPGQPLDMCSVHVSKAHVVAAVMGFELDVRVL